MDICSRFKEQTTAFYSAGICLKNSDRHQEAISYFEQLLKSDPTNESAWINKAQCEIQCKDYLAAEQTLLTAQKHCTDYYPLFSEYANLPRISEDWNIAADRWTVVCRQFNEQTGALYSTGVCLRKAERHEEAIQHFTRLLKLDPTHESGWINKAQCEIQCENYNQAQQTLLAGQKQCPDYYPLFSEYANLPRKTDNWDLTASRWKEVCLSYNENPDCQYNAAVFLVKAGRNEEALTHFDRLLASKPSHDMGIFHKAACLISLERYDEARTTLLHGVDLYPDFTRYQIALANLAMTTNRLTEALEHWQKLVDNNTGDSQATFGLAVCYMKMKKYRSAAPYLSALAASTPNNKLYSDYNKRCQSILCRDIENCISAQGIST